MMKKISPYITCPMCGFTFHVSQGECTAQCPLAETCNMKVCPNCGYSAPAEKFGGKKGIINSIKRMIKWLAVSKKHMSGG